MNLAHPGSRLRQRGAAAIELALILPILIGIVLAPLVLWAQYMWHYTIVHKAAQDAAQYMASVPRTEMNSEILTERAIEVASEIVRRELGDLAPEDEISEPAILCDADPCGFTAGAPTTVRVAVAFRFHDNIFRTYLGPNGLPIEANVTMSYVGK